MAERCPTPAVLEAFASADLPDRERHGLEAHLLHCLECAEEVETMTRAQLEVLIGDLPLSPALASGPNPALERVMLEAGEGIGHAGAIELDRILEVLDAPAADDALGTFAGYDILAIAGRGGMGVIFKARDRTLNRIVAMKVIVPRETGERSTAGFLEEARAVAALQHDHIVVIHHAGMAKDLPYLVMPYHTEGTLERRMVHRPGLGPMHVARVGLQLAQALAATHARGILHRDIKPSNVLLEDNGDRVRLADFGLARAQHLVVSPTARGDRCVAGTPQYMSPEQARGEAVDGRSDLFSLGAVMFEMAAGRPLFPGESSARVLSAAACCDHQPTRAVAPDVPPKLATIIDRLVAKRPDDRFQTAADVAAALERFVQPVDSERRRVKWPAVVLLLGLTISSVIAALDWSGRTAVVNTLLSQQTGKAFYLRGRFGAYARLSDAVAAARPHDVIEVRFSGERLTESFRVGGKPLTIRSAPGFRPILLATNNAQPLITADAPLALEGLTLWRRGRIANFALLISTENAPLHLLNCRILRSVHQGQNVLVYGRLRLSATNDSQRYRALLGFQHGSIGYLRNCVVAGTVASGIEMRASAELPTRVEIDNSLFVVDRGFYLNPEAETGVRLSAARSVFVTSALLDLARPPSLERITISWQHSILDRGQGTLLRLARLEDGASPAALDWKESGVLYAGQGGFATAGDESVIREADWNRLLRLSANSHQLVEPQAFPEICVRSCQTMSASDLDREAVNLMPAQSNFDPGHVGEGAPYEKFRRTPAYRQWQREVRAAVDEWEQRQGRGQDGNP